VIEHAVYASARSQQREGYQVVAASAGIAPEDIRELALWCPSHDGLIHSSGVQSINAHKLPSGAHCVGRSFAAQAEYSGRGGTHVVTHALVISPDDYARFANNPFAVMRAAVAAGQSTEAIAGQRTLEPFGLVGRARPFDSAVVRLATAKHALEDFASALETCLAADVAAIATQDDAATLMAALLNCLPPSLRPAISLATGLVYSSTRPYRWVAHTPDPHALRHLEHAFGVSVAMMPTDRGQSRERPGELPFQHAWVGVVYNFLREGRYAELERHIQRADGVQNVAELDSAAVGEFPLKQETVVDRFHVGIGAAPVSAAELETVS
jgi:hypothetical protein